MSNRDDNNHASGDKASGGAPVSFGRALLDDVEARALVMKARRLRTQGRRVRRVLGTVSVLVALGAVFVVGLKDFTRFSCRAKQGEARTHLKSLYVAEESFRAEYDRYTDDFEAMNFRLSQGKLRYRYLVVDNKREASEARFRAYAFADLTRDVGGRDDVWMVDQSGSLEHLRDGCAR